MEKKKIIGLQLNEQKLTFFDSMPQSWGYIVTPFKLYYIIYKNVTRTRHLWFFVCMCLTEFMPVRILCSLVVYPFYKNDAIGIIW